MFLTTRTLIAKKGLPPPASGFATLDPSRTGATGLLYGGNLSITTNQYGSSVSNIGKSSGKWYFEAICVDASQKATMFGVVRSSLFNKDIYPGAPDNGWSFYFHNGNTYINDTAADYAPSPGYNEWVGCYVDLDAGLLGFISEGVDRGIAASGLPADTYCVIVGNGSSAAAGIQTINFGATPFAWTPPSGYNAGWFNP
ncbi:MAG: SPRY domain-containing protein [Acidovorax sp.]|uniref:SPRY domain-containing protein n=1 Tax=Acidovorax sp. TaxID=1872122 RepID=UPI0026251B27|nr:SPRY domain-containing protein [Acidovorax sp.]MDH4418918.1 SPRY domain-containing protein [Acidovorax sp.]